MRRGGGPEPCVDEVSGVENRQVVSPPQDERLVGQVSAPHPAGGLPRWALTGRAFSRAGLPGVGEHPRPDANWSADENLDNFGAGAVN